jgi:FkbM family methyltransferase
LNYSAIRNDTLLGALLRLPLRLVPSGMNIPILQGAHRGKKWIVGSSTHGCWLGSYEHDKRRVFEDVVGRGSVVFDIGAHVGFYTILASVLVGPSGRVISFEPLPRNLEYLRRHINLNRLTNITVVDAAVGNKAGRVRFEEGANHSMGRVTAGGHIEVESIRIDQAVSEGTLPAPSCIKIDVEGAELDVLDGACQLLTEERPTILMATHGSQIHEACCSFLTSIGYRLTPLDGRPLERSEEILAT